MSNLNASNETSSMHRVYENKKEQLDDYVSKFQAQQNDIGIIYAIGNKIEGVDIFHGSYLFQQYLPKIIKSCVLEIIEKALSDLKYQPVDLKSFLTIFAIYPSRQTENILASVINIDQKIQCETES